MSQPHRSGARTAEVDSGPGTTSSSRTGAESEARATRRYRRPSGEPPPLPRDLRRSGLLWAGLAAAVVLLWVGLFLTGRGPRADLIDQPILQAFEAIRTPALTRLMRLIQRLGSDITVVVLAWLGIGVAVAFRRYRHAAVFVGCIILTTWITTTMSLVFTRPRPEGIEILGTWHGFSHPSRPVANLALCLVGLTYMLVPQGRWRVARGDMTVEAHGGVSRATWVVAAGVLGLGIARMYLAIDHPTDFLFGAILGIAIPLVAFRALVPAEVFPITYRRGRAAHLDISGRRGQAMVQALRDQLGLEVLGIEYHGLEGSGGSTPLRIRVAADGDSGEAERTLFGKLYAANHLRADRWYKLGRTLLYGRLEDEFSFSTVRRLVQYEDYLLRLMHAAALPTPEPFGFVEITPEREYLIVTEFFKGATEIGDAEVDEQLIDGALEVVGALWDAGLAHRDIKPSNILVRDREGATDPPSREVLLIDLAFAEVRPSPWRQAVDLANMMLVLSLNSEPELVYERALRRFTAEDVAEAFAATRGVTMPTQLRAALRQDGRDLVGRFRALAGNPRPVRIQRWSLRRLGLLTVVLLAGAAALALAVSTMLNLRLLGFPFQLPLSRSFFLG